MYIVHAVNIQRPQNILIVQNIPDDDYDDDEDHFYNQIEANEKTECHCVIRAKAIVLWMRSKF